jgi:hypothetical protein
VRLEHFGWVHRRRFGRCLQLNLCRTIWRPLPWHSLTLRSHPANLAPSARLRRVTPGVTTGRYLGPLLAVNWTGVGPSWLLLSSPMMLHWGAYRPSLPRRRRRLHPRPNLRRSAVASSLSACAPGLARLSATRPSRELLPPCRPLVARPLSITRRSRPPYHLAAAITTTPFLRCLRPPKLRAAVARRLQTMLRRIQCALPVAGSRWLHLLQLPLATFRGSPGPQRELRWVWLRRHSSARLSAGATREEGYT